MKIPMRSGAILFLLLLVLFAAGVFPFAVGRRVFAIAPENVLVIYNGDQGTAGAGFQIADYYQQARPGIHVAAISGVDAILDGALNEVVTGQNYLDVIRPQILSAIGAIPDSIDVIVTTKGMPLRVDAGSDPGGYSNWKRYSSFESEVTRIDQIDTNGELGNQQINTVFPQFDSNLAANPYFDKGDPFVRVGSGGIFNEDIRLSSRLDGYSVQTVKNSIDRAQDVYIVPFGHDIVVDDTQQAPNVDQMTNSTGEGDGLFEVITGRYPDDGATNPVPILFDNLTENAIVSSTRPVIGYVSHGVNDGPGPLEPGYIQNQLNFELANGAVFQTHESYNALSFDPSHTQGQGLIAEWLEIGGAAGLGHVQEPYSGPNNVTNEDIFYEMFLPEDGASAAPGESGLTFVEAAWNATRQLSFVNTVVGDPLMRIQAWLPGDTNLDGVVEFNDFYTLQGNWQQSGTFEDGDFNGDGTIDEDDFIILQDNWLTSVNGALPSVVADIVVNPMLDAMTSEPILDATLLENANVNGDLNVDGDDLAVLLAAFGADASGDVDGDGDTDGADFLLWQRQFYVYSLTADFDIDGGATHSDLGIWENSFNKNMGGDADGDGDTDGRDFLAWQREFSGMGSPATAASLSVPEPSAGHLAGCVCLLLTSARRRRV